MFRQIMNHLLTGGHPYRKSPRRRVYEEIAEKYDESPDRVYLIAHNPNLASFYDTHIITDLADAGIIVRK